MALISGTKLGLYEIQSPLGAGGMGEVYRARDTVLKRDVAIKVLPAHWSRDPDRLRRFELEAQAAAALNHPNIVSIFHVGEHDGTPYIVTELLHGESLRDRLCRGAMRVREVLDTGVDIARGLATAHHASITHRDLKPENVFLTKDGRVKILDFGLAKLTPTPTARGNGTTIAVTEETSPGHVMGTVGYMSPEQAHGAVADARSDIFAVGVILYEMLTGQRAFRKPTAAETMSAILNEDPPPISQKSPSVPPGLQRIVARCLAKNPEQRFQHASDLSFALEAISDSGTSSAIAIDKAPGWRWPWIVVAVAVIAVLAVVALWWRIPAAVPVVESISQLTDDGEPKLADGTQSPATDGMRIYFNEGPTGSVRLAQVSVTGGRTAHIESQGGDRWLQAMSPDGSALLVLVGFLSDFATLPVWSIPVPAGEPRRLGDEEASCATYFPDGRLLLVKGTELYVAEKDGSNPRPLVTLPNNAWYPSISPDGRRIVVTSYPSGKAVLTEVAADGSVPPRILGKNMARGTWSADGKYLIYGLPDQQGSDLWALPMRTGWFHRSAKPIRLTNGALLFTASVPSRDGKQLFTIGDKPRSELVRFDTKTHHFLPFFGGVSAISPTFSADGKWMEYTSYPDHALWRSRSDGRDRMQLTFSPIGVRYPNISYDGSKVAFVTSNHDVYVVSMQGGSPRGCREPSG